MPKRKIAILGGGMAGLSAAFQLTRTQALRDAHEVTVYQIGWRLGGKAASGRDVAGWPTGGPNPAQGRNLEHGLHVWFGCYENTFQMIQEIYAARQPPGGWALPAWPDAVKPQDFTPIGVQAEDGAWSYWPLTWAVNGGVPGDGALFPTVSEMLETLADWILLILEGKNKASEAEAIAAAGRTPSATGVAATPFAVISHAKGLLSDLAVKGAEAAAVEHALGLVAWARDAHAGVAAKGAAGGGPNLVGEVLDIFLAVVTGMFADLILPDRPLVSIDDLEFRAWLLKHGANPQIVAKSSVVRVVYDTLFQYAGGNAADPNVAAGTGLGVVLRLVGTYKGSMMWEVQAGMGEVMVGPLYQHLLGAGVNFQFFSKVVKMEPGPPAPGDPRPVVQTVTIRPQALAISGGYQPVKVQDGLVQWPSEPDWGQLQNGAAMKAAGVNFESHWCDWPAAAPDRTLTRGVDFDDVLLAIALGAFKPLNEEDVSLAAPLIAADTDFAAWVDNVAIVPSMGVQLWCNQTRTQLGWQGLKPATVSGPEYLDIWADMTQVLAFEPWPAPKPLSLHYLTGTWASDLYMQPASQTGTPAAALADVRSQTIDWLNQYSAAMWPLAHGSGGFDWDVLAAPEGVSGVSRLDYQFIRANVDPTECCTLSAAGTTQYRPHAASNFANLYFAGEGTAMGFTTSFEGSVMSGAAASRAICGAPERIVGYSFLDVPPSQWSRA